MPYFYLYLISAWSFALGWSAAAIYVQNLSEKISKKSRVWEVSPPTWPALSPEAPSPAVR